MLALIGPGAALSPGADWLQAASGQVKDTLTGRILDSVVVDSPLPDPMVPLVQWIFQKPGWLMASGIILAAIVVVVGGLFLWRRRQAIWTWLATRERGVKLGMAAAVGALLLLIVWHQYTLALGMLIYAMLGPVSLAYLKWRTRSAVATP